MPATDIRRTRPDKTALATRGKQTSQIRTQEQSDKALVKKAIDDKPLITSARLS